MAGRINLPTITRRYLPFDRMSRSSLSTRLVGLTTTVRHRLPPLTVPSSLTRNPTPAPALCSTNQSLPLLVKAVAVVHIIMVSGSMLARKDLCWRTAQSRLHMANRIRSKLLRPSLLPAPCRVQGTNTIFRVIYQVRSTVRFIVVRPLMTCESASLRWRSEVICPSEHLCVVRPDWLDRWNVFLCANPLLLLSWFVACTSFRSNLEISLSHTPAYGHLYSPHIPPSNL